MKEYTVVISRPDQTQEIITMEGRRIGKPQPDDSFSGYHFNVALTVFFPEPDIFLAKSGKGQCPKNKKKKNGFESMHMVV